MGCLTHLVLFWDLNMHGVHMVLLFLLIADDDNTVTDLSFSTGDVSPISMSPISQSQFIPLGEVLLLAISAMNSAHKPVTQEALTEHLQTCFPGNTSSASLNTQHIDSSLKQGFL